MPISGALLDKLLRSLGETSTQVPPLALIQPSTVPRPSLRHFQPQAGEPAAGSARVLAAGHRRGILPASAAAPPLGTLAWLGSLAALGLVALALVLLALRPERAIRDALGRLSRPAGLAGLGRLAGRSLARSRPPAGPRLLRPALVAIAGLTTLTVLPALAAGAHLRPASTQSTGAQRITGGTAVWAGPMAAGEPAPAGAQAPAASVTAAAGRPALAQLVTLERQVSADQIQLAAQERALKRITVLAARSTPAGEDEVRPAIIAIRPIVTNQLAEVTAVKQATQQHYEQAIQAEYDLFRTVAPAPAAREGLLAAAAEQASPEVRDAISFNLAAVQTQMAQEAAISAAEAHLKQLGTPGSIQLEALSHHQPLLAPEFGVVTQPFGPTDFGMEGPLTYHGVTSPHFHWGLDIGCALDTPIHAAADGVVVLATASRDAGGNFVGYGNHVVVAHPDGMLTLYAHLNSIKVQPGDIVRQGQVIGLEGSTGWSTGPHLHFEVRQNGQLLDPRPLLGNQLPA